MSVDYDAKRWQGMDFFTRGTVIMDDRLLWIIIKKRQLKIKTS